MSRGGGPDVLLIEGMPTDPLKFSSEAPSLSIESRLGDKGSVSEFTLLGLAGLFKYDLFTNPASQHKGYIHQVSPRPTSLDEASGLGLKDFHLHVEESYEDNPPDILGLHCLWGDASTSTTFLPLQKILDGIDIDLLQTVLFEFEAGSDFEHTEPVHKPIVTIEDSGFYRIRLYENDPNSQRPMQIRALDAQGEQLLDQIQTRIATYRNQEIAVKMSPGDVVFFKNGINYDGVGGVMHTRRSDSGQIQDVHRWLQRVYLNRAKPVGQPCDVAKASCLNRQLTEEGSLIVSFETGKQANPFSDQLMDELTELFETCNSDDQIRSIVITGGQDNHFSAGGDFNEVSLLPDQGADRVTQWIDRVINMYQACLRVEKPVVMAVDKSCIGIGFQLAMCADVIVASDRAEFVMPELKGGIGCSIGSMMLERAFSRSVMLGLTMNANSLPLSDALASRFVSEIVSPEQLVETAGAYAKKMEDYPVVPFKHTKVSRNDDYISALEKNRESSHAVHSASFKSRSAEEYMDGILGKKKGGI